MAKKKKITVFIPNDGFLNFIEENDQALVAGFDHNDHNDHNGHALGNIPRVPFKTVKVAKGSLSGLYKGRQERPRS